MNAVLNFLSQWKSDIRHRANLQNGGKHGRLGFEHFESEKWTSYFSWNTGDVVVSFPTNRESVRAFGKPANDVIFTLSLGAAALSLFFLEFFSYFGQSFCRCSHFTTKKDTRVYSLSAKDSDTKCILETQNSKKLNTTPGTFRKRPLVSR